MGQHKFIQFSRRIKISKENENNTDKENETENETNIYKQRKRNTNNAWGTINTQEKIKRNKRDRER